MTWICEHAFVPHVRHGFSPLNPSSHLFRTRVMINGTKTSGLKRKPVTDYPNSWWWDHRKQVGHTQKKKKLTLRHARATQKPALCAQVSRSEPCHVIPLPPLPHQGDKGRGSCLFSSTHAVCFRSIEIQPCETNVPAFLVSFTLPPSKRLNRRSLSELCTHYSSAETCHRVISAALIAGVLGVR